MEFFITAGCEVEIVPKKAVMASVRMDWSLSDFYSDGGTSKFADRIASALGIHASRIKVVSVYEGSVAVNYHITADDTQSVATQISQVTQLTTTLASLFTSGTAASILGAPVLSAGLGTSGVDLIASSSLTTSSYSSSSTASADASVAGVGETMRAAFTAFAPMLYALDKNPEILTKLAELANTQFLSEEAEDSTAESDDSEALIRAAEA